MTYSYWSKTVKVKSFRVTIADLMLSRAAIAADFLAWL